MLTNEEKNQLNKIYAATCRAFDKILDADVLRMQIEDLADLDYQKILNALNLYRRDEKSVSWPRANKIRTLVNPTQSTETLANEAASRIRLAISLHGHSNPSAARAMIGELGWRIVERSGGWQYVCENHGLSLNPLTFHAQAREIAKALLESEKLGLSDVPINLPASKQNEQLTKVQNLLTAKEVPK